MRIAVCGTHGIGKTTLAEKISKEFGFHLLKEQASRLLKTKYSFLETECSFSSFMLFQKEVLFNQLSEEQMYWDNFIADRSIIDSLIYVHVRTIIEQDSGKFLEEYLNSVLSRLKEDRYDKIIFLRYHESFSKTAEGDIRNLNPVYMKEIDEKLDYFFLLRKFKVLRIESLNFDERVQEALRFIREKE